MLEYFKRNMIYLLKIRECTNYRQHLVKDEQLSINDLGVNITITIMLFSMTLLLFNIRSKLATSCACLAAK